MNNQKSIFMACDATYKESKLVLFGAPFDGTSSYRPGSRFAPAAIRTESFGIETYSPYLKKDLENVSVFDAGDIDFPLGNTEKALSLIEEMTEKILFDNKIPLMLGGEHLITLGSLRAAIKKYPNLNILHFDAHADLRDNYMGERLSHATVLRRCFELLNDGKIFQFGIRSMTEEEDIWANENVMQVKYNFDGLDEAVASLKDKPVYLTVDLDVLDPSVFSGTGTPESGGVSFIELMKALHKIRDLQIVACDINELSPHYDPSGVSTITACKVVRETILSIL